MKITYQLEINEYQRVLMLKLMNAGAIAVKEDLENEPGDQSSVAPCEHAFEEAEMLCDIFNGLPSENAPGTLHSLYL
jgi:hypothetical protein